MQGINPTAAEETPSLAGPVPKGKFSGPIAALLAALARSNAEQTAIPTEPGSFALPSETPETAHAGPTRGSRLGFSLPTHEGQGPLGLPQQVASFLGAASPSRPGRPGSSIWGQAGMEPAPGKSGPEAQDLARAGKGRLAPLSSPDPPAAASEPPAGTGAMAPLVPAVPTAVVSESIDPIATGERGERGQVYLASPAPSEGEARGGVPPGPPPTIRIPSEPEIPSSPLASTSPLSAASAGAPGTGKAAASPSEEVPAPGAGPGVVHAIEANIAGIGAGHGETGKQADGFGRNKTSFVSDKKEDTKDETTVGIGAAQPLPNMASAPRSHPAALLSEIKPSGAGVASSPPSPLSDAISPSAVPTPTAIARRAVENVARLAELQSPRGSDSDTVTFGFRVGNDSLSVRVEWRQGEVRTQFSTDSADLRSALAAAWPSLAETPAARSYQFSAPVFTGADGRATDGGGHPSGSSRDSSARDPSRTRAGGSEAGPDPDVVIDLVPAAALASGGSLRLRAFA